MPDLSDAVVSECKQIPAAMFQYLVDLVESLAKTVKAVVAAKETTTSY